jgi:hypothetical protein
MNTNAPKVTTAFAGLALGFRHVILSVAFQAGFTH